VKSSLDRTVGIVEGWREVKAARAVGVEGEEVRRLIRGMAKSFEGGRGGASGDGLEPLRDAYVASAAAEMSESAEYRREKTRDSMRGFAERDW
jgi:hypothetical protein